MRAQVQPRATVNQLAWGIQRKSSPYSYVVPDVRGDLHNSLSGAWWLLEYLPKSAKYKEWPARKAHFGYYIPDAEPRLIPEGAIIHESAVQRMDAMPSYRPVNLPKQFETFPMPVPPVHACERGGSGGMAAFSVQASEACPLFHDCAADSGLLRCARNDGESVALLPFSPCGRRWIDAAQRRRDG